MTQELVSSKCGNVGLRPSCYKFERDAHRYVKPALTSHMTQELLFPLKVETLQWELLISAVSQLLLGPYRWGQIMFDMTRGRQ